MSIVKIAGGSLMVTYGDKTHIVASMVEAAAWIHEQSQREVSDGSTTDQHE